MSLLRLQSFPSPTVSGTVLPDCSRYLDSLLSLFYPQESPTQLHYFSRLAPELSLRSGVSVPPLLRLTPDVYFLLFPSSSTPTLSPRPTPIVSGCCFCGRCVKPDTSLETLTRGFFPLFSTRTRNDISTLPYVSLEHSLVLVVPLVLRVPFSSTPPLTSFRRRRLPILCSVFRPLRVLIKIKSK